MCASKSSIDRIDSAHVEQMYDAILARKCSYRHRFVREMTKGVFSPSKCVYDYSDYTVQLLLKVGLNESVQHVHRFRSRTNTEIGTHRISYESQGVSLLSGVVLCRPCCHFSTELRTALKNYTITKCLLICFCRNIQMYYLHSRI